MDDAYSHSTKAGNEGDVAKLPVLVAAVNALLDGHAGRFRYADTFAGAPMHRLLAGGEWEKGIGRFPRHGEVQNSDIAFWTGQWVAEPGAFYPGSSMLARAVFESRGVPFAGRLWDKDSEVVEQLVRTFPDGDAYRSIRGSATPNDLPRWGPDLLFIDPPGLHPARRQYPALRDLLGFLGVADNLLIWLPITAGSNAPAPGLSNLSLDAWRICLARGMGVLPICWASGVGFIGCLLAFRLPEPAAPRVRSAADSVIAAMGWEDLSARVSGLGAELTRPG